MNILIAASESVPFAKSGGLGDVIGALPKELAELGADVRIILPKYEDIPAVYKERMEQHTIAYWDLYLGWRQQYCGIQVLELDGVTCYFVDNEYYFKRRGLYGYGDEAERFVFFSRAVLEAMPRIGFQPDIVHSHDWQTGLIPYLLRTKWRDDPYYANTKSVFTIHNLMYQGVFNEQLVRDLAGVEPWDSSVCELHHHDGVSCLKGGIAFADRVTTVSPSYAEEIQTAEHGEYLDGLLRYRREDLRGILNGVDMERYNPMQDSVLEVPYRDSLAKKRLNKLALQRELGLPESGSVPLIGMVTRLVDQKGFDLIEAALHELMQEELQLVVLGTGEHEVEQMLQGAAQIWPEKLAACIRFDDRLARRIYAGSDLFLMPSRFEPCGIGQLMAYRYRSVPIVRETGGLKDTVKPYNQFAGEGTGFSFAPYAAQDLLYTVRYALAVYQNVEAWKQLHRNIRKLDYSWVRSAKAYMALYRELLGNEQAEKIVINSEAIVC